MNKIPIAKLIAIASDIAKKSFYSYCRFMMPHMYSKEHQYLKELCDTLQDFIENKLSKENGSPYDKLMINMPPRHSKSLTIILFCQWLLGVNRDSSIITTSYSEALSVRMAKSVRDGIQAVKIKPDSLVYSDFFPQTKIKKGDAAMQLWSLEDRHFSYLATSPGGALTGLGGKLILIDDLIKNWYEACNERILDEHLEWYDSTLMSRKEADAKQILIMTRWSSKDIAGRLLEREGKEWFVVKKPAKLPNGQMLAPDILNLEEYEKRASTGDAQLIAANYQQEPFDSVDRLYPEFKTYLPALLPEQGVIEAAVDTADEGNDFLTAVVYKISKNTAYVLDVIYTQDSMEVTEQQTAVALHKHKTTQAWIESNNGGRGFSRNVERIMREVLGYSGCRVRWFSQTQNKVARILSNATNVVNSIIFPDDWAKRWPQFYSAVTRLGRNEKWVHDDAPDVLTMIIEKSIVIAKVSAPSVDARRRLGL
jgi:predicted phage terminase large subunit-like protein